MVPVDPRGQSSRSKWLWIAIGALAAVTVFGGAYSYYLSLQRVARAASCRNDVFYLREYIRAYAADHDGLIPPLSQTAGNLTMDPTGFYPEYLENACWLQCEWSDIRRRPNHHKNDDLGLSAFNDDSLCYLPWAMTTEAEGLAFVEAYKHLELSRANEDLEVEIDGRSRVLSRTRLSKAVLDQTIDENAPLGVPIAIEWPDTFHSGGTVLFSNGWIVTMQLGDEFPMTPKFIAALREIAQTDNE